MPASAHNPKTLRCVKHVMAKGHDKVSAIRICQTSTGESYRKAQNAFCPTGEGGGIDNSCSSTGGGKKFESDQLHILKQLADGDKSINRIHRLHEGVGSAMSTYHKTVMPAQELEKEGYIEKVGTTKGDIGVGASYAGPGSAPTSAEKDDPARSIYRLTDKGREAMGLEPKPKEVADVYDKARDHESRFGYAQQMLSSARSELKRASGKPRLEKAAKEKIKRHEDSLRKLRQDFPEFYETNNQASWRYVTANFRSGKTRTETLNGKEYIVAPMTLIVPGVLNGSQGALYYPASEIAKNYKAWEDIPITVYHPHKGGNPVSAKDKGVMNRQGVGFLKNPQVRNGRLIAEGWFDSERTKRVDSRVYEALSKNEKMELSTGLYTNNIPAQNGAKDPKGRAYTHTATDHVPDHLAVLPDQKGACSLNDGCGMLVNSNDSLSENAMAVSRPKLIKFITANCDCYKGKEKVLENEEAFSDDDLKKLKTAVENSKKNELIVNAAKEGFKDGENEYKFDETEGSFIATKVENAKAKPEEDEEDDEEEMPMMVKKGGKAGKYPMNRKKQTDNSEHKEPKVQTEEEWFKAAPVGVRNMFLKQKRAMVDKIVANVSDEDEKESKVKRLMAKNTEQLEEMLEFIPERPAREEEERFSVFGGDYSASAVAPIGNREVVDDDEILDVPTINWAEEKANENKRRMQTA